MSEEGERTCPLCMEEMDLTDQQLKPCKCGYEICVWCWHHIMDMAAKDDTEGRCPACRTPYDKERIVGMTVSSERLAEIHNEKKQRYQKAKSKTSEGRKHLSTVRVIQRNLVYIVGIPANLANEETLQRKEFFGQYGKILKVSITRTAGSTQHSSNNSCSVYITYSKNEEAIRCIQVVNGFVLDGRPLRACFGTTKYCHAWLRNMPCGNPDCLYLHDAGTQEDTFTKDEAISTCASKFQHSPGSALTNFQQRPGSVLPPPIDNFCSNNTNPSCKPLVKPAVHNAGVHSKISLLNGDTGKSGLPAAASWGIRVIPSASPTTNAEVSQGPKHKPSMSNSFASTIGVEAQSTTQTCDFDQHVEHIVASRNHRTLTNGRLETFQASKPSNTKDCQAEDQHIEHSHGRTAGVKSSLSESSHSPTNNGTTRVIAPLHCSLESNGYGQPTSNPMPSPEVSQNSTVDESTQMSSTRLHPLTDDTSTSESLNTERNTMISSYQLHEAEKTSEPAAVSVQDNIRPGSEALGHGLMTEAISTSKDLPSLVEQSGLNSRIGVKMLPAQNLGGRSMPLTSDSRPGIISNLCTGGVQTATTNDELSSEREKLTSQSCERGEVVEISISQNSNPSVELNTDEGESNIITDILSLDIGQDDPLASPDIAKLLLGNGDKKAGYSRLFSPWKSNNNNESRFSFARMDDSNQESDGAFPLDISKHWQGEISDLHDREVNHQVHVNRFPNGTALTVSEDSEILNSHHHLLLNIAPAHLSPVSRQEVPPPPRSPIQRKAPSIPPPGFYPQHALERDQYPSMLPSHGSTAQYQFLGGTASLNQQQQVAANSTYADVEFIDPAIMAVSRGKLPLPMTHQISPNYGSNLFGGFSEMDQRLQLLKSRSSNLNQNPMVTVDQSKYNLLRDMALQEAMRNSAGSWGGAWNVASQASIESGLLGRRGESSLAEITNSGRVGYLDSQYGFLRSFPAHEDTKFQASNSGRFYNSAYDL